VICACESADKTALQLKTYLLYSFHVDVLEIHGDLSARAGNCEKRSIRVFAKRDKCREIKAAQRVNRKLPFIFSCTSVHSFTNSGSKTVSCPSREEITLTTCTSGRNAASQKFVTDNGYIVEYEARIHVPEGEELLSQRSSQSCIGEYGPLPSFSPRTRNIDSLKCQELISFCPVPLHLWAFSLHPRRAYPLRGCI
jgi:hypothetical protein